MTNTIVKKLTKALAQEIVSNLKDNPNYIVAHAYLKQVVKDGGE